ncbi:ATP-binding domain-containing protein [uncultured Thiodictyon sp.]|uniref:ATP-binding domain-containing protein n=1 Tax=uncultured Thiodictyon sp. TaxID=1846217 RepID=UPI0025F2E56F|nr:ATP-binding domain-containing protein [uncultured Thiodictyon sp.]
MAISEKEKVSRSREELAVLEGVIDYADQMVYQQRKFEYESLRRHAYGKTVVIETEKQGIQTFRLSSTPVVYPSCVSGYATPHSPVGRLCSFLKPGDEDETPRWGEYRVLEVRLFDRFDGILFEQNVKNFLRMTVDGDPGKVKITNLRSFLAGATAPVASTSVKQVLAEPSQRTSDEEVAEPISVLEPPHLRVDAIPVDDDEVETPYGTLESEEEDLSSSTPAARAEEYYGLSETFYINRTREQDEVMSRSPMGPMFVEGVAGSGKTSAALGRTKMLSDFNVNSLIDEFNNLVDESKFRAIVGEKLDYWSEKFSGQFSQQSCVGFVRTGELIQYLRETCRRLDLPNLPVQEYSELRSRLRLHRRVERSRPGASRWAGLDAPRETHTATTMAWLKAADRAIAAYWSRLLIADSPTTDDIASAFAPADQTVALRVGSMAVDRLRAEVARLASELNRSIVKSGFALDRLASRIQDKIQQIRQDVLGKDVLWVTIGDRSWTAPRERDLAQQLMAEKVPLFLRNAARLVFLDGCDPVDDSLVLLSETGDPLAWGEETRALLEQGSIVVRDPTGITVPARLSDVQDLYLRLLPEATDRLYVLRDGKLRPLGLSRGLGKRQLTLVPKAAATSNEEHLENSEGTATRMADGPTSQTSVDRLFNSAARRALIAPLAFLADAYSASLAGHRSFFPDPLLAACIDQQLRQRKLAEEDLDLLLCIAHIIGRGFTGIPRELSEPPFYQAVFVDEVQDFTEQQVFLMVEQARPEYGAVTVVGDIAQKLHNGSVIDILACFPDRSVPRVQLTENLRQLEAPGLAWFSACFRAHLQDGLTSYEPSAELRARLLEHADYLYGPELSFVEDEEDAVDRVIDALRNVQPHHTAAVILNNQKTASVFYDQCKAKLAAQMVDAELSQKIDLSRRHVRHFTSVTHAKGLEFDVVIVPYLESYDFDDPAHINRLYVALTRSRCKLILLSHISRPLSAFDSVWERYENTLAAL